MRIAASVETREKESPAAESPAWGRWIVRAVLVLSVMMGLYLAATIWATRGDLIDALKQLPLGVLPIVVGLVIAGWALRALRWHYYVRLLRWAIPFHHSMIAFVASFAFTATPGKTGEVIKSVLLRTRYQVPLAEGVGVLLVERLGDLLAVIILATGGLALLSDALVYFVISVLLVGGMTVFVGVRSIYAPILLRLGKIPKLSGVSERLLRLFDTSRELLRPTPFLLGVGVATIAWSCEGWAFHILIRSFGVQTQILTSCSIFGVATLVGALSALPGGLGSFEVVMVLLLTRLGMSAAAATLPVVVFRLASLWLGSFVGLIFMLFWLFAVSPKSENISTGDSHD